MWEQIWTKKGEKENIPLHHYDGFEILSQEQYVNLVKKTSALLHLNDDQSIIELGCGAGAYLYEISKDKKLDIHGIDYSHTLINKCQSNINGTFICKDITKTLPYSNEKFDVTMSFGVFMYLQNYESVTNVLEEMNRITKDNGTIFVGEISDLDKKEVANSIRSSTHKDQEKLIEGNLEHLYIPKQVFIDFAERHGYTITIFDGSDLDLIKDNPSAAYRYYVYIFKQEDDLITKPIKINLGSGNKRSNGWLNCDINPGQNIDIVKDVRYFNMSEKCDMLRASHVLEHIDPCDLLGTLINWFWSLKPGGTLIIGVPDFESVVNHFLNTKETGLKFWKQNFDPYVLTQIYGISFLFKEDKVNQYDRHKMLFTESSLKDLLETVGFIEIERFNPKKSFENEGFDDFMIRPYSLNIKCIKPDVKWKFKG